MEGETVLLLSDLPEPYYTYASIIGIENFYQLAGKVGGRNIYFPTQECVLKYTVKRLIREEYQKGSSITELAEKYGMARKTIYAYLK